jgi:phosphotransferase system enzyme I (PtsI)
MFPMITTVDELRQVRGLVSQAERELDCELLPRGKVRIGMMVEVPVAAIGIEAFLPDVDFVSIGSNDLVQYLTASDRDNPKVSHLCNPLNPSVIKVLSSVIASCGRANKPVSICGEMAGMPAGFFLLLGLGLRSFSISPAFIPAIKDLALRLSTRHAKEVADDVQRLATAGAVEAALPQSLPCTLLQLPHVDARDRSP